MIQKLTLTFKGGKKKYFSLKSSDDLKNIDPSKKVEFIFLTSTLKIYEGYSDGHIDEEGEFMIKKSPDEHGAAFPANRLMGWRYRTKSGNITPG